MNNEDQTFFLSEIRKNMVRIADEKINKEILDGGNSDEQIKLMQDDVEKIKKGVFEMSESEYGAGLVEKISKELKKTID